MMSYTILVAGGSGKRMGGELPKQFLTLAGIPILVHSLRAFWAYEPEMHIVLVMNKDYFELWSEISETYLRADERAKLHLCAGGKERINSVEAGIKLVAGLAANDSKESLVAIHDAVRPLASPRLIGACFEAAASAGAAIPVVPVKASLRRLLPSGGSEVVPRSDIVEVQTPQCFQLSVIANCLSLRPDDSFTDEASLYQFISGNSPYLVQGDYQNLKITTPEDMLMAETFLAR